MAFLRERGRGRTELGLNRRTQSSIADFIGDLDVSKDLVKVRGTARIVITLTSKIACHLISSLWWVEGERERRVNSFSSVTQLPNIHAMFAQGLQNNKDSKKNGAFLVWVYMLLSLHWEFQ